MAFFKLILSTSVTNLKCASTRRFSQPMSTFFRPGSYIYDQIIEPLSPSIVVIQSCFSDSLKIPGSRRTGVGVFLDSASILTSAHLIGHVTSSYEPKILDKPDRFEHGSIIHKAYLAPTVAHTVVARRPLEIKPVAVNFSSDVAVLKVVVPPPPDQEETSFPRHRSIANSPPNKDDLLMSIAYRGGIDHLTFVVTNVRSVGKKTFKVKAPWPLDNDSGWIELDASKFNGGNPPPCSKMFNGGGSEVTVSMSRLNGCPWFNVRGEVVGVGSWEVRDHPSDPYAVFFGASLSSIKAAVEYANTKKPEDPIVMDGWIKGSNQF
ncbi:hypothetical protein ABFS82_10G085700 [Erythranthe guttata]|uniref:uncharacterized protein LOC105970243 n=1 Tax=Erythranthe guttata TaxID=4155 RepID=UPI00064DBD02|nr:PREDICTED: uncharacterized protein LOC105970243 [Erythranthe guttata]XP_012850505.1 PREDICTED: uncharacterized protein LOC105970243 [Erythranthe guttata]|eukprot:XP_012850504.1 PREDICTED: uncharacterized protein LOC105970243 [Erythranthe guttata]